MLAAIALGSNVASVFGEPTKTLLAAVKRLEAVGRVVGVSSFYDTAPVGYLNQPRFVNAAVVVETELNPNELLRELLKIELEFGRDRSSAVAKGPRTLDLDLILYGTLVMEDADLVLPHPAMHERRFVLEPLREVAGDWVHPVLHRTVTELLALVTTK